MGVSFVENLKTVSKGGDAKKVANALINRTETHEMSEDELHRLLVVLKILLGKMICLK